MAIYNLLSYSGTCPHCKYYGQVQADFRFGYCNLDHYKLGDELNWGRDKNKCVDYVGEGYVECPKCYQDYWVHIIVKDNILQDVQVNPEKKGYMSK